ncbi:PhnA-like protein [Microvirga terricola]|uniref:PhnA-like protein n=1 Tax=Microvirga terricola TaxID=2719797 RepID=UPI001FEF3783|nr:PhnA-like protein [Microvirga terricola]
MVDRPVALAAEDARTMMLNRISWGAVFAGVVIALVTQLVLNTIGIGIGVSTLNPSAGTSGNPSAMSLSIGAGIWFLASGIIASFAGGYAASRLAGKSNESTGGWHGLTAWALTTLVIVYLLTSTAGSVLGGAYSAVTSALGGMGRVGATALQAAAPSLSQADPFNAVEIQIRGAVAGNDPGALRDAAIASMRALLTGDQTQVQALRERAAAALARAQSITDDLARARVLQLEQQYRQAVDQAKLEATRAADAAAQAVARGALFGSLALIVGALAGWFGGRTGTVRPTLAEAQAMRADLAASASQARREMEEHMPSGSEAIRRT